MNKEKLEIVIGTLKDQIKELNGELKRADEREESLLEQINEDRQIMNQLEDDKRYLHTELTVAKAYNIQLKKELSEANEELFQMRKKYEKTELRQ